MSVVPQAAFTLPAIIAMSENSNSSQREHVIRLCNTADNNFLVVSKVHIQAFTRVDLHMQETPTIISLHVIMFLIDCVNEFVFYRMVLSRFGPKIWSLKE